MEGFLKRRNLVLTDSEDEEPEAQGRKGQADPQDSSIQGLVTPPTTKAHASGEEQEEDISPNTLEAAKTLSKEDNTGAEKINAASIEVNTASKVNTGSIELNTVIEQRQFMLKQSRLDSLQKKRRLSKVIGLLLLGTRIASKLEANARELSKSMLGSELQGEDLDQGSWEVKSVRKLSFEEVNEEFDKLVKQIVSFAP
ncbi:hypothetical protein Tco_0002031 [Tanacetum coccineum]